MDSMISKTKMLTVKRKMKRKRKRKKRKHRQLRSCGDFSSHE
jgi:hypothetical protein